jgi:large subunit ribosomal protein L19
MSQNDIMTQAEARNTEKDSLPEFEIGDSVDVQVRITEGDKTRIQVFSGTVIARKHSGLSATFTVRRLVGGEGVERVFPLHSPNLVGLKVTRHGVTRRAKLYFLRDRVGKGTRLKERRKAAATEEGKARTRKRGAKAKAERKKRAAAEGTLKKKKRKNKKKNAEAKA